MRCNQYGDLPDGRHITELEDADLSPAELALKQAALVEAHEAEEADFDSRDDGRSDGYGESYAERNV